MSETVAELRIRISERADVDVAHDLAAHDDRITVQETTQAGGDLTADFEPITAVLVGGAVVAVGKFIADWWERPR